MCARTHAQTRQAKGTESGERRKRYSGAEGKRVSELHTGTNFAA